MTPEQHLAKLRLARLSLPDKDAAPTSPDELLQKHGIIKDGEHYYREGGIRVGALASFLPPEEIAKLHELAATASQTRSISAYPTVARRATVAIGWNVAVILVGSLIALIGVFAWLLADPGDSAPRQTVAALWLLAGILGVLIAAVGILGATLAHALRYDP
jgi:hypothetical protein